MLRFLRVANIAVIENVEVEFEPGLNLLTGETGSGKSLIVDAVTLLLGERAGADVLRSGEAKGYIEGVFRIEELPEDLRARFQEAGVEVGEELIFRREITAAGRSRIFANDRLVTQALVRAVRPYLVDVYSQGEAPMALAAGTPLRLLDSFAQVEDMRRRVEELARAYRETERALEELARAEAERLRLLDIYQFQIREIERVRPVLGEDDELGRERALLANAERLFHLAQEAYAELYEAEDSVLRALSRICRRLEQLREVDERVGGSVELLERARICVEEVAYFLREYRDGIRFSPERLAEVEARLAELERVKRKYGPTLREVLETWASLKAKYEELSGADLRREQLEHRRRQLEEEYRRVAAELSQRRQQAARALERAVTAELRELAFERGRFQVVLQPVEEFPSPEGAERAEFLVAVNVGEEPRPVAKAASGGELSRLMLALKTVAARWRGPRTLIFDEIDAGIGGRVAEIVGERLRRLGERYQVLCVTHQPQIARFADAHYRVVKEAVGGRTRVRVERLSEAERIEELARMLGGREITETVRRHARELIGG
jgi:DNA repair protein RecN (Recombination protein N)